MGQEVWLSVIAASALRAYSAPWRLEVVEAVAYRAERGLVVPAVAGRTLDHSRCLGERDDLSAAKQPDQTGLVVSG